MSSEKRKVLFLDRDGVVNRERGEFTWKLEDFQINDGVFEALNIFREHNFEFIIISNQSGIARGLYEKSDVEFLHHHLKRAAVAKGISILDIYYCPHHPDSSRCICRKPDSLLLEKAIARYHVDSEQSRFIGDAERDISAANKVGLQAIRIQPNSSLMDLVPLILGA